MLSDIIMSRYMIEGAYYMNHFIGNMAIVYYTYDCMINSYIEYYDDLHGCSYESLDFARDIIYALHLYHIIMYFKKLRKDDIIHHLVMVGIALPLTSYLSNYNIIGHGFFFVTGLPGGIDYFLLFLVRNEYIDRMVEKDVNKNLNLWVRCPGCISNVTLIICSLCRYIEIITYTQLFAAIINIISVYWNGIYFMEQVLTNYVTLY